MIGFDKLIAFSIEGYAHKGDGSPGTSETCSACVLHCLTDLEDTLGVSFPEFATIWFGSRAVFHVGHMVAWLAYRVFRLLELGFIVEDGGVWIDGEAGKV